MSVFKIKKLVLTFATVGSLAFLTACGKEPVVELNQFSNYVANFEAQAQKQGIEIELKNLVIQFGDIPGGNSRVTAACISYSDGFDSIIVNETMWEKLTETQREIVIFHELGHCILERGHIDEHNEEGIPVSMMNSYLIDGRTYDSFHGYYMSELFDI